MEKNEFYVIISILVALLAWLFPGANLSLFWKIFTLLIIFIFVLSTITFAKWFALLEKISPFLARLVKLATSTISKTVYLVVVSFLIVFATNFNFEVIFLLIINLFITISFLRPIRGLRIIKATYGSPSRFIDVTKHLSQKSQFGRLLLSVTNSEFGKDPHPGVVKKLIIKYSINGVTCEKEFIENSFVSLP